MPQITNSVEMELCLLSQLFYIIPFLLFALVSCNSTTKSNHNKVNIQSIELSLPEIQSIQDNSFGLQFELINPSRGKVSKTFRSEKYLNGYNYVLSYDLHSNIVLIEKDEVRDSLVISFTSNNGSKLQLDFHYNEQEIIIISNDSKQYNYNVWKIW